MDNNGHNTNEQVTTEQVTAWLENRQAEIDRMRKQWNDAPEWWRRNRRAMGHVDPR
jgi:hypothetical protein